MPKRTIVQAILAVLRREQKPLIPKEIYEKIVENDLYRFKAQKPAHIVLTTMRRSLEGLDISKSQKKRHFVILKDGRYWINGEPITGPGSFERRDIYSENIPSKEELLKYHNKYTREFRHVVREYLKELGPEKFEAFSRNLLEVYGFKDVKVTGKGRDGGIDGYGKLKVGMGVIKVGFQCKNWRKTQVGLPELHKFRSPCQAKYHQGIFFTTNKFSRDAPKINEDRGMIPIILMDIEAIIDLMIEKQFGVQVERELPMYLPALEEIDELLSEEE